MEKKYYLAYGSNLNIRQMRYRCPTAKPIGITVIPDYELLYKGSKTGAYLTIEPKKNGIVPIAVWEVTAEDEKRLDAYEGCPTFYYKKEVRLPVKLASGKTKKLTAFVYIMDASKSAVVFTAAVPSPRIGTVTYFVRFVPTVAILSPTFSIDAPASPIFTSAV